MPCCTTKPVYLRKVVVDSSAIVSILFAEPDTDGILMAI
jgi:hypothetical protein